MSIETILAFGVLWSIGCGLLASNKHRSVGSWMAIGFFLGVFAFVAILCMPKLPQLRGADGTMLGVQPYRKA